VRRLLIGVLLLGGIALVVAALRPPSASSVAARSSGPGAPLWSVRRVPSAVTDLVGAQRLQAELSEIAAGTQHCFEVRDGTAPLAAAAPEASEIPASTLKLLTAAAALYVLGPDYRYTTRAVAASEPQGGVVEQLYLVGVGDPVLSTPERVAEIAADPLTAGSASTPLAQLADGIVAVGVQSIPGGVIGVDDRFDTERFSPRWPASYRSEIGAVGALVVNGGKTGPSGAGGPSTDPALDAAAQLTRLLAARGVVVGAPGRGRAPDPSVPIATVASPPLTEVLTSFLASSDNLAGEMLVKELAVRAGTPGTTANGVQVVMERLAALGIPLEGVTIVDGSGLSRDDRATCNALLATLALGREDPRYATLRDGLAVAGERGTLATRLVGTPLAGRLVAKTGSLNGVSGLAGVTTTRRPLDFALLLNGQFSESSALTLRERMAAAVAAYPNAPDPDTLVPAP